MSYDWETNFNPRRAVPEAEDFIAKSRLKSQQAHEKFKDIEQLRYGDSPLSNMNFRRARQQGQALFIFIHGGYWRGRDKDDFGFVFEALAPTDANVAILNYDLCPKVSVAQICAQIRDAMLWFEAHQTDLGFDASKIYVAGHSAGAHLIAMTLARGDAEFSVPEGLIHKAYLISGIYELSPVLKVSVNQEIKLEPQDVGRLSPGSFPGSLSTQYDVIVGQAEPPGWVEQSVQFAEHLKRHGAQVSLIQLPQRHHYSILQDMEDPSGELSRRFIHDIKES